MLAKIHNASKNDPITQTKKGTIFSELERIAARKDDVERKISGGSALIKAVDTYLGWGRNYRYEPVLIFIFYWVKIIKC